MTVTDELVAEVAEAEAAGLAPQELNALRGQVEGAGAINGLGMAYQVPDTEKATYIAAWRLSIDHAGVERGEPVMLAKGGLGTYLAKRRPVDGGRLFTLKMPESLVAPRTFPCFAAPNFCTHKSDTKMNLIDHMEAAHPREAAHLAEEIAMLRKSASKDNPALQELVRQMAERPDPGVVAVPESVRASYDATVPQVAEPELQALSVNPLDCPSCDWAPKAATKRPDLALNLHIMAKHPQEVE